MNCSTPGFLVLHYLPEFAQAHVCDSVMASNCLILCRPLLLLPPIFPSIRVFSSVTSSHQMTKVLELQYQSFSEYSGLISFRIDWFDILAVQRTLKSLLQHCSLKKIQFFCAQSSLWSNSLICTWQLEDNIALTIWTFVAKCCLCFLICFLGLS